MAAASSPAASSLRRSQTSSTSASSSLKRSREARPPHATMSASIPAETLVTHVLAAKRSLSTMTLVLRANDLATSARHLHEDSALLAAQAGFVRAACLDQAALLVRARRGLQATYDWGKRDFKRLVRAMDEVDAELEGTMDLLRGTEVHQEALRSEGGESEEKKSLMDFVDEENVHGMKEALKKSIQELQSIQQSFDGDLLRFETDIRDLKKILTDAQPPPLPETDPDTNEGEPSSTDLLYTLDDHSSHMASLLTSLTKHFDMCVTAIRTTEGAAALVRRKAAEASSSSPTHSQTSSRGGGDPVSISGVIAEQEQQSDLPSDLEPKTPEDRAEMLRVVVADAEIVEDVVREIHDRLADMEHHHVLLEERSSAARGSYAAVLLAFEHLHALQGRLPAYVASESEFRSRWDLEAETIGAKLESMREMRTFYEGYASAYDSLVLEVERRRGVEDKVAAVWRKAQEGVDKLLREDGAAREAFRVDVGEFLPTDLWTGMKGGGTRWRLVQVEEGEAEMHDA